MCCNDLCGLSTASSSPSSDPLPPYRFFLFWSHAGATVGHAHSKPSTSGNPAPNELAKGRGARFSSGVSRGIPERGSEGSHLVYCLALSVLMFLALSDVRDLKEFIKLVL